MRIVILFSMSLLLTVSAAANPVGGAKRWLEDALLIETHGFLEARVGLRLRKDPLQEDVTIGETRFQLDLAGDFEWGVFKFKGDLAGDEVDDEVHTGLREFHLFFSPLNLMDVKAGRQILTWGTGDLLFINDLFPKDWESFFIGRTDEYLKAPSDALKVSLFSNRANVDVIFVPRFNPSRHIDGGRISYWNGLLGGSAGRDVVFGDEKRDHVGRDSEVSVRLSGNMGGIETALYGYYGFWKTPEGIKPAAPVMDSTLFYPRLTVVGASLRSPILGGIGNVETGYYHSIENDNGDDPFIRNSEVRVLAGYEHELGENFTGAAQYYLEYMRDYDDYEKTFPSASTKKDELRHLITLRLTRLLMNQNLRLSLFAYYSPSDEDGYLRLNANYKITDNWAVDAGANIFVGGNGHTFFGQFEDASNIYTGLRWNF